jgi:ATP-dependent DNA helicase RecG
MLECSRMPQLKRPGRTGSNPAQPSLFPELNEGFEPPSETPDSKAVTVRIWGSSPPSLSLIPPDEIFERANQELLRNLKEDRRIERKLGTYPARGLGEYICMWANTSPHGGLIVVGMEDDGSFKGCEALGTKRINDIESAGRTYCPDARIESKRVPVSRSADDGEDFVLLIRVRHTDDRVVENNIGEAYIRVGDSKHLMKESEKRELQHDRGQVSFELEPSRLDYPHDFDTSLIKDFCNNVTRLTQLTGRQKVEEILHIKRLGRWHDGRFTPNVACELLFARDPAVHFPGAKIRFLRFEGEKEGTGDSFNAIKDEFIEGPIPELIPRAEAVIKSQLREFSSLGRDNKFYTAKEYPETAWYEAVVNAVIHRSYGLRNMTVFVKMFDDRLEVESPGGFPPFVTPENIYLYSNPRNRHLAEALYYFAFVKLANEGTRRMRESMREASLPPPEFRQRGAEQLTVNVILRNDIKHRREWLDSDIGALIGETLLKELKPEEKRVLRFLVENGKVNVSETMRLAGRSWRTAKKILDGLARRGLLTQVRRPGLARDPEAHFIMRTVRNRSQR